MNFKNECLMKNLFKVLFVAAATIALFGCSKEIETPATENPENVRTVQFSAGPITKTVFGTPSGTSLPTLWTDTKTVGISLNLASVKQSSTPTVLNGGVNATFNADIEDDASGDYTFYAISPYSAVLGVQAANSRAQVDIPASQTPLANSVDEGAQILVAQHYAGASFPTTAVALDFEHLTAYAKISFSNLSLAAGEAIASVSLTAPENWVGRYYYYFDDYDTYSAGDIVANSAGKTLTVNTTSSSDIWFACAPVDLGGQTVKVVITTDKSTTYTKNITIPAGKTFASGKVNQFTINMNGITADTADEYELVTDASELTVGSEVIIAASGATAVAMSTTQNGNNRGQAAVTKSNSNTVISGPSDAVQILTVAAGNKSGTIAFYTGSGYLYAASSSNNYLRTEDTLSDNSSWVVSIDSGTGVATITAQGSNTRNVMQYNSSNSIFACYSSASQGDVAIYKLPGTGAAVLPKVTLANDIAAVVDEDDIIITWTDPSDSNVDHYVVTCTGQADQDVDPVDGGYIFENLSNGSYTVSVKAVAADSSTHRDSDAWESSALVVSVGGSAVPTLQYTLSPVAGTDNGYATSEDIEVDGITWNVTGNATMIPWRIGGKNLSGVDRAIFSKTTISANITSIEITHGTASSITVNSMTVIVSKNADFSSPVSTLTPSFASSNTVTVNRPDGKDWSNCYYKIVYNVSVSGSTNRFIQFTEAKFYGTN